MASAPIKGVGTPTPSGPVQGQTTGGGSGPDTPPGTAPARGVLRPEQATKAEVAAWLDVTPRALDKHIEAGRFPRIGRGFDLKGCVQAYCRHMRETASGRGGAEAVADLTEERARLAKAQADAQEMKNATLRGELVSREDVDAAVMASFARVRARLLGIPPKLAPVLVTITNPAEAQHVIRAAVYEALRELADTTVADLCRESGAHSEEPHHEAAPSRGG